ncbi:MAG: T9SS type A sorting domain-containing protein [Candidatus Syntrophosphaera sp.]|nr:T9SS type A sorting domain-containing protein [Candidatus Syntrophosphaera sp.]
MLRPLARLRLLFLAGILFLAGSLSAQSQQPLVLDGLELSLGLYADARVAENTYQPISFNVSSSTWPDSSVVLFSSPELDLAVAVSPTGQFASRAWQFSLRADFKQETYLHELYLNLSGPDGPAIPVLKGIEAIQTGNPDRNRNAVPYTDMALEYTLGDQRFWTVASNYAGCEGVEGLTANRITLYDYRNHFFRLFNPVTQRTDILRDTMYKPAGGKHRWGFLLFTEKPVLLDINRWLGDSRAALCITNDADGEILPRLQAVFEGSTDPASPKYLTQGFFARGIPVSTTIHGSNQSTLGQMWTSIQEQGNSIGYHTFATHEDPPGTNAQALLHDLLPYGIRHWIDHAVPFNPEDLAYSGLDPESLNFVGNLICQAGIDYAWPADTPLTNPFNAFEEPWHLPHIVYEASSLTRPVWFYGRTRMEVWEYNDGINPLCFKYMMTPDNLDLLLAERGLHISYTHFCSSQFGPRVSFYQYLPDGSCEVRDDVDEMLQMLDWYRRERGLWIATLEDIFDRMLALELVKVVSVQKAGDDVFRLSLANSSALDIADLCLDFRGQKISFPLFAAGETRHFYLREERSGASLPPSNFQMLQRDGFLLLKSRAGFALEPMRVDIYNLRGQKVGSHAFTSTQGQFAIPFAGKGSGIYFARLSPENGITSLLKFTVIK